MRKGIKLFLICCAAAGCAKVGTETDTQPKQFTMIVEAESPATKTFVHDNGDNTYAVNWSEGDQIAVWETAGGETVEVPSTPLLAETGTALFSVTLDEKVASSYKYFAAFPASRASKIGKNVQLVLPKDQMFKTTTFDKTADILISGVKELNSQPSMLGMNFARVGATAKLVITGIGSGETVDKIVFSTTEHEIAGTVSASIATGALQPGGSDGYNSITLQPATTLLTDGGEVVVWFRLLAGDLTDNLSVRVEMDKAVYDKTVDLATAGKTIAFADGALTKFKVNVGATREGRYSYSFRSEDFDDEGNPASSVTAGDLTWDLTIPDGTFINGTGIGRASDVSKQIELETDGFTDAIHSVTVKAKKVSSSGTSTCEVFINDSKVGDTQSFGTSIGERTFVVSPSATGTIRIVIISSSTQIDLKGVKINY